MPPPAVVELLRAHAVPGYGGPLDVELATPTGVAIVATLADSFGPMPPLVPSVVGVGAGGRDPEGHANVLRVVVGTSTYVEPVGRLRRSSPRWCSRPTSTTSTRDCGPASSPP